MMTLEPFSAVAMCPACAAVAVHWLAEPRFEPTGDTPLAVAQRHIAAMHDITNVIISTAPSMFYDDPNARVARVCRDCGFRWNQR